MSKAKKVILSNGEVAWEVREKEGGRTSKELRRRFASSKLAQDFLDEFRAEKKKLQQGYVQVGSFYNTTFANEAKYWLEDLKIRSAPGHYRRSEDNILNFNKNYGNLEPNKITPEFLTRLQRSLKTRPGKKKDSVWSNASVNRYTEAICAALNFAASQKRIPFNPLAGFKKLPRNSKETHFWDEEEASSFLAWADRKYCNLDNKSRLTARKNYIAYLLALNTGMRAGEIWGLKPHDLIFNGEGHGDTIFVRRQYNAISKDFAALKGEMTSGKDKSRHVPCPRGLRKEFEALIQRNGTRGDQTIFQSVNGSPIDHDSFGDKFDRDVKKWGGRRIRFHDLRHTAATLMLAKGIDVKTVSEILGHETLATTMIYVHLLGGKIRQVSQSFSVTPSQTKPQLHLVTNS